MAWAHREGTRINPLRDGLRMFGEMLQIRWHGAENTGDRKYRVLQRTLSTASLAARSESASALDCDSHSRVEDYRHFSAHTRRTARKLPLCGLSWFQDRSRTVRPCRAVTPSQRNSLPSAKT